jgi:hypothetical protein
MDTSMFQRQLTYLKRKLREGEEVRFDNNEIKYFRDGVEINPGGDMSRDKIEIYCEEFLFSSPTTFNLPVINGTAEQQLKIILEKVKLKTYNKGLEYYYRLGELLQQRQSQFGDNVKQIMGRKMGEVTLTIARRTYMIFNVIGTEHLGYVSKLNKTAILKMNEIDYKRFLARLQEIKPSHSQFESFLDPFLVFELYENSGQDELVREHADEVLRELDF